MILFIDNYDSFTYNLVQYFGEIDGNIEVYRNDQITIAEIAAKNPDYIIISPGPCTPLQAGVSVETIRTFAGKIPILGVCLGHQAIGYAFGAKIGQAKQLMHGKTSLINHDQKTIFANIPNPFRATRYHSLVIAEETLSADFAITARTLDGEIMAIRHRSYPLEGVQFHPESILTEYGKELIKNFLDYYQDYKSKY